MDLTQVALKLVLDEIGEDHHIYSVNDRLRIQKAIYLAQAAGINLSYHYSWYVKGPYSTALTQDYYKLNEALNAGDTSHTERVLNADLTAIAPRVKDVLSKPEDVDAPIHTWYETLASLHFLIAQSKYTFEQAKDFLNGVKPHINLYVDRAFEHLRDKGLIAA